MALQKSQKTVLVISTITNFLGPFLISSVTIALPTIEKSLQLDSIQLSWIISAYLLTSAIVLLPAGKLADNLGQVVIYRLGIIIFTVSTLACGFSSDFVSLIFFRILQGVGGGLTMATGAALLVSHFPAHQRGRVLGINVAAVYLGLSVGPFIGGLLTHLLGWRSIFFISAPLGLFSIFLTFLWLKKDNRPKTKQSSDVLGYIFYSVIIFLFVFGTSKLPHKTGTLMLLSLLVLMPLFIYHQNKSVSQILPVKLFKENKRFTYSLLAALINYGGTFAITFYLSLFLDKVHHLTPQVIGLILVVQPITQAFISPFSGYFSDRIEPRLMATSGMFINGLGLIGLAFINQNTPIYLIIINLIIMGFGFALFSSPNMNTIMGSVTKNQLGLASGMAAMMRVIGQMISMSIAALLFSINFGNTPVGDVDQSVFLITMKTGLIIMGFICLIGTYFSHFRGSSMQSKPDN